MGMEFLENGGNDQCSLPVVPCRSAGGGPLMNKDTAQKFIKKVTGEQLCEETMVGRGLCRNQTPEFLKLRYNIQKRHIICDNYRCVRDLKMR